MSGKKESFHVDMAGVALLSRKERPAGLSKAPRSKGKSKGIASSLSSTVDRRRSR